MTGKTTKAVMAIFAVALMMMVAFVPAISVLTDDGSDAAFTTGDFTVTVTDKGGMAIFGLTVTATLTAQNGSSQASAVTANGDGTYTFKVYETTKVITLAVADTTGTGAVRTGVLYTFTDAAASGSLVIKDATSNKATVVADQYSVIAKITDAAGKSVSKISVTYDTGKTATTNSDGIVMFPAVGNTVTITTMAATDLTFAAVKNAIVFTGMTKNISYTDAAHADILTFKSNEFKFTFSAKDKSGNALNSVTVSYTLNTENKTAAITEGGSKSIYVFTGDTVVITGVEDTRSTDIYTFPAASGTYAQISAPITVSFTANEYTGFVGVKDATSKVAPSVPVAVTGDAKVTVGGIGTETDADGRFYFAYKFVGTNTSAIITATATATATYTFATATTTIDATVSSAVGALTSTSFTLSGSISDANGVNGAMFKSWNTYVNPTVGCKVNGSSSSVTVSPGDDGTFSFVVAPSDAPTTDTIVITANTATNGYGYTFDTTVDSGAAYKKVVGVNKDTPATSFALKANESTVKISGTVSGLELSADKLTKVNYTINAGTAKNVFTSATGAYSFSFAKGASITAVGVDTSTTSWTVDTKTITNAAKDKTIDESAISFGKVVADKTQNFAAIKTPSVSDVTIEAVGDNVFNVNTKVTMTYKYGSVTGTKTVGTTSEGSQYKAIFAVKSVPNDAVFEYTLASEGYAAYTGKLIAGDAGASVAPVMKTVYKNMTLTITGATSAGENTPLSGIVVKYGISDSDKATVVYDKTATTDADGKITIECSKGQYYVYDVQKNDTYTFKTSGLVKEWTAVTDAALTTVKADQANAVYGNITLNGMPLAGVTVSYDVYAGTAPLTYAKTVKTDSNGLFTIFGASGTNKVAIKVSQTGYAFGTNGVLFNAVYTDIDFQTADADLQAIKVFGSVTVSVSYIASSSLENVTAPGSGAIVAGGVSKTMSVGETATFTAPEVKGFTFSGWYLDGVNVSDSKDKTVCNFTATEAMEYDSPELVAVYGADSVSAPAQGVSNAVIIIGVIAVIIALLAVAYVVIQTKKKD